MQQGFYVYRNNIYFGSYPVEQVSGYQNVSLTRSEYILTDRQIGKEDQAVRKTTIYWNLNIQIYKP